MAFFHIFSIKTQKKIDMEYIFSYQPFFFVYLADLIFDPTLACWNFRHQLLILSINRQVLLLSRAMLTLPFILLFYMRLRGSFCPRLAWTFNHRPNYLFILYLFYFYVNIFYSIFCIHQSKK